EDQALMAFTRCARRETLREAVLRWTMPLVAARCSSGWAARSAASAAALSPEAIASSTLRMKVRTRERRALLIAVRRSILRAAFFAEVRLAICAALQAILFQHAPRRSANGRPQCQAMREHAEKREPLSKSGAAYSASPSKRQSTSPKNLAASRRRQNLERNTPRRKPASAVAEFRFALPDEGAHAL